MVLHRYATAPISTLARPDQMSVIAAQSVGVAFAGVGQYLLPILCIAGAAVSFFRRRHRKELIDDVASAKDSAFMYHR